MAAAEKKKGTPRKGTPRASASAGGAGGLGASAPKLSAPRTSKVRAPRASRAKASLPASGSQGSAKPRAGLFAGIAAKKKAKAAASTAGSRPAFLDNVAATTVGRAKTATSGRERREKHQRAQSLRVVGFVAAGVLAVGLVALVTFFALRNSSIFSVEDIQVEPSAHVSQADVANLLYIDEGATLLNVSSSDLEGQLKRDPWVESVTVERQFPHTLKLTINETQVDALVVMSSGSMGWYLGSSGSWIEPAKLDVATGESVNDAALARAQAEGILLITGVPATVEPSAGSEATDDVLEAVRQFRQGFSEEFSSQIVSYDASSADAISCVTASGVQISLGSASNISYKEEVAAALLEKYPGQLTYINVRVPSSASVRRIDSADVTAGTGTSAGDDVAADDVTIDDATTVDDAQAVDDTAAVDDGTATDDGDAASYDDVAIVQDPPAEPTDAEPAAE